MRGVLGPTLGSMSFFVLAPGTVAGWVPWWISRWRFEPAFLGWEGSRVAGAALVAAGLAALLDCFARFALQGRGTPAPVLPTERLVVSGLYRHVRNPMYLAVVSAIAGQALLLGSADLAGYTAVVWTGFHVFVMAYEEPTLRARYGAAYEAYGAAVRRWLPRRVPWSAPVAPEDARR